MSLLTALLFTAAASASVDQVDVYVDGDNVVIEGTDAVEHVTVCSTRADWVVRVSDGTNVRSWRVGRMTRPTITAFLGGGDDVFTALPSQLTYTVDGGAGTDVVSGAVATCDGVEVHIGADGRRVGDTEVPAVRLSAL